MGITLAASLISFLGADEKGDLDKAIIFLDALINPWSLDVFSPPHSSAFPQFPWGKTLHKPQQGFETFRNEGVCFWNGS